MAIEQDQFLGDGQLRAICLRCGASMLEPFDRCEGCGFLANGDDLVKATYLSVYRYFDAPAEADAYSRSLNKFQNDIRAGQSITFDPSELSRIRVFLDESDQTLPSFPVALAKLVFGMARLHLPMLIGFFLIIGFFLFAFRSIG